jgi:hypothetical protein
MLPSRLVVAWKTADASPLIRSFTALAHRPLLITRHRRSITLGSEVAAQTFLDRRLVS